MPGFDPDARQKAAEILFRRLSAKELRQVLKEADGAKRSRKGIERIIAEVENPSRLLRTRVDDNQLASFLVDIGGQDLLAIQKLRYLLAVRSSPAELDRLHEYPLSTRARGTSEESIARCIAERHWHPGKSWARHFVSVLGFPPPFAGLVGAPGGPEHEDVQPHVPLPPLEDFQEDLRRQVVDLLSHSAGANRAVLTLPTGAGKTRTTVEALIDWWLDAPEGESILWVAQSDELCEQAVQAFAEVWIDRGDQGVRDALRIYRFWGGKRVPEEDASGVIVSTIDKLRQTIRREPLRFVRTIGAIVVDEAHRAEAPSYREVLEAIGIVFSGGAHSSIPLLGLTATPLRSQHDETIRLAKRFYNTLLRPAPLPEDPLDAIAELRTRGVLSKPVHRVLPPTGRTLRLTQQQEEYLHEWKELPAAVLAELGQEKNRNKQLLETLLALDAEWPVLFFGCSVQHAEAMAALLRRRGRSAEAITSDTREATRRHLVGAFKNGELGALCNYGVLTTGFDAPKVRAIVIGRPTASRVLYEQMIGRGMRGPRFGGTEECLVIDVDDNLVHFDGTHFTNASRQYMEYWVREADAARS